MQAIRTRYLGPTEKRQARIKAECEAGSVSISYDDQLDLDTNHKIAMLTLREKVWLWSKQRHMISGVFRGDYYWVFQPKD